MNKYKMFFTLLFSMMLMLVALTSGTTETYAQGNATYNVTRWTASGRYIRIELANRGTGLGVTLKKSGRDGNGYRFTNRGHYYIDARTPNGQTYSWGPYWYDSRIQNYAYSHTIWPERVLPPGEVWYQIRLYSENDPYRAKYTGYAKATTNCPYNWRYGIYICN